MTTTTSASLLERLETFMASDVYPAESVYREQLHGAANRWSQPPVMDELQAKARAAGLWNLFLPESEWGAGLSNRAYAPLCEVMGRSFIAPEVFNCSAPDTGNMEVFARYASRALQDRWLKPLLAAEIRSGFAMTEPGVASWTPPTSVRRSGATVTTTCSTEPNGGRAGRDTRAAPS